MKNIIKLVFTLLLANCNAQQIINLENQGAYRQYPQGAYFKDMNNFLDLFTGTYLYTNGNTSLKIVLIKRYNENNGLYSEDLIYGGYEYKVNGVTLANTLPNTLPTTTFSSKYNIHGNSYLLNDSYPPCNTCAPNEKRLFISLRDSQCKLYRNIVIKKEIIGGQELIEITIMQPGTVYYKSTEPEPEFNFILPSGDYMLIKQ